MRNVRSLGALARVVVTDLSAEGAKPVSPKRSPTGRVNSLEPGASGGTVSKLKEVSGKQFSSREPSSVPSQSLYRSENRNVMQLKNRTSDSEDFSSKENSNNGSNVLDRIKGRTAEKAEASTKEMRVNKPFYPGAIGLVAQRSIWQNTQSTVPTEKRGAPGETRRNYGSLVQVFEGLDPDSSQIMLEVIVPFLGGGLGSNLLSMRGRSLEKLAKKPVASEEVAPLQNKRILSEGDEITKTEKLVATLKVLNKPYKGGGLENLNLVTRFSEYYQAIADWYGVEMTDIQLKLLENDTEVQGFKEDYEELNRKGIKGMNVLIKDIENIHQNIKDLNLSKERKEVLKDQFTELTSLYEKSFNLEVDTFKYQDDPERLQDVQVEKKAVTAQIKKLSEKIIQVPELKKDVKIFNGHAVDQGGNLGKTFENFGKLQNRVFEIIVEKTGEKPLSPGLIERDLEALESIRAERSRYSESSKEYASRSQLPPLIGGSMTVAVAIYQIFNHEHNKGVKKARHLMSELGGRKVELETDTKKLMEEIRENKKVDRKVLREYLGKFFTSEEIPSKAAVNHIMTRFLDFTNRDIRRGVKVLDLDDEERVKVKSILVNDFGSDQEPLGSFEKFKKLEKLLSSVHMQKLQGRVDNVDFEKMSKKSLSQLSSKEEMYLLTALDLMDDSVTRSNEVLTVAFGSLDQSNEVLTAHLAEAKLLKLKGHVVNMANELKGNRDFVGVAEEEDLSWIFEITPSLMTSLATYFKE